LWTVASQSLDKQLASGTVSSAKTFVFLGEKRCGKTSLIQKFFDETPKDDSPPTTALEYRYSVKTVQEKKVIVNTYELGGGRTISSMIGSCMSAETLPDTCVCICVDLSKPGNAIESVMFWLNAVREQTEAIAKSMENNNSARLRLLQQRINDRLGEHEDRSKMNPMLVPVVLICTKYDEFANQYESARKKIICLALRYIAHMNGASLVFGSVREKVPSQLYKAMLLSNLVEGSPQGKVETNQNQPINMPSGCDKFS